MEGGSMAARNERTSPEIATLASRILNGGEYTRNDVLRLAASALTQAADTTPPADDDPRNA